MGMRTLPVLVVVLLSGCLVPLDVLDDGGSDAGTTAMESDASCELPHDAGIDWSPAPCKLAEPDGRPEGPSAVLLPGCRQDIQVFNGAGAMFPVELESDSVGTRISANWPAGMYIIRAGTGGEVQMTSFEVYDQQRLDAGTVRTFAEPINDCTALAVTAHDRLVCSKTGEIIVFDSSGAVRTRFSGRNVAVAGDELWSIGATGIELRLDGPNGPDLVGARIEPRLFDVGVTNFGETKPGSTLRGSTTELIEFTWDGTTIASQSWPLHASGSGFVYREGEQFWNDLLCKCTSGVCEECQYRDVAAIVGFGPGRLWAATRSAPESQPFVPKWRMLELMRPLSFPSRLMRTPPLAVSSVTTTQPGFELPVFTLEGSTSDSLVLVNSGRLTHFRLMKERVRAITNEVILSEVDSSTLRFTPNALTP